MRLILFLILVVFLHACAPASILKRAEKDPTTSLYDSFVQIESEISYTMCKLQEGKVGECKEVEDKLFATGSGFAVSNHGEATDQVFTARHICRLSPQTKASLQLRAAMQGIIVRDLRISGLDATTDGGQVKELEVEGYSEGIDACETRLNDHSLPGLELSQEAPERGEEYLNLGATLGVHGPDLVLQQRGFYSGQKKGMDIYTIPVAGGSSGGPILTQNGEVVGLVSLGSPRFHDVTFSPSFSRLHFFISKRI